MISSRGSSVERCLALGYACLQYSRGVRLHMVLWPHLGGAQQSLSGVQVLLSVKWATRLLLRQMYSLLVYESSSWGRLLSSCRTIRIVRIIATSGWPQSTPSLFTKLGALRIVGFSEAVSLGLAFETGYSVLSESSVGFPC